MIILLDPNALRELARQWRLFAAELREVLARAGGALSALDWDTRVQTGVEDDWNRARRLGNLLLEDAEATARFLERKAQEFEETDAYCAAALLRGIQSFARAHGGWESIFPPRRPSFPTRRVVYYEQLAVIATGASLPPAIEMVILQSNFEAQAISDSD
ncbi:MAG: hypothetical protein JW892_03085 [Anaerolineae bacterium]|nr:hypothetical protein [Anaerolineae bacterium]